MNEPSFTQYSPDTLLLKLTSIIAGVCLGLPKVTSVSPQPSWMKLSDRFDCTSFTQLFKNLKAYLKAYLRRSVRVTYLQCQGHILHGRYYCTESQEMVERA